MGCRDDTPDVVLDDPGDAMSHADTIRRAITGHLTKVEDDTALAALDALLAENQQLREALERILTLPGAEGSGAAQIAREALAGDAE